jgi:hypothetical protein
MTLRAAARLALVAAWLPGLAIGDEAACAPDRITLLAAEGRITYTLEIADTPETRARGLMFRTDLAADSGMLFVWDEPAPRSFWMRNTPLPLDIIFLDEAGQVVNVAARTTPFSEKRLPSEGPALAVLEVNAGEAERRGIGPGTQARHPVFVDAPEPHRCPG